MRELLFDGRVNRVKGACGVPAVGCDHHPDLRQSGCAGLLHPLQRNGTRVAGGPRRKLEKDERKLCNLELLPPGGVPKMTITAISTLHHSGSDEQHVGE